MHKFILFILAFCFFPSAVSAWDLPPTDSDFLMRMVQFGQAPDSEMVCIKGPCAFEPDETDLHRPFITYQRPVDITHLNQARISAPEYSYFHGQLFQIYFTVLCPETKIDSCVDRILERVEEEKGLSEVDESWLEISRDQGIWEKIFLTDSGEIVDLQWQKDGTRWETPKVKIYDEALMDSVRREMNPHYTRGEWYD